MKTGWSYYIRKLKEESLELDFKLNYKEKRFNNTPKSEYDQILVTPGITYKKKDIYSVNFIFGLDNFDYLGAGEKDQLKIFSKIGGNKYFLEKKLMLTGFYKLENTEQEKINRKRRKQEISGGFDYIFDYEFEK